MNGSSISFPKKAIRLLIAIIIALSAVNFQSALVPDVYAADDPLPYLNTNLTFEERAADLVTRMTDAQKVAQLYTGAPAIAGLSVPAYNWWQESIRGPRNVRALSWPTGVGMSMSFDDELFLAMGTVIGDECRAYYRQNGRPLSQFNPTINLGRDPRWGRNEEGFGEDPYLVGRLGTEYVAGLQGERDTDPGFYNPSTGEKYIKAIATPKHYAANNSEFDRYVGNSQMDERELREYYTYHFRYVSLNSNPGSLMTAYNAVNDVPMFAHTYLNNTMMRKMWGFDGYVVSDCDGIMNIVNDHKWNPSVPYPWLTQYTGTVTNAQASAFSLMGGTDLACNYSSGAYSNIATSINNGVVTDNGTITYDAVDRALVRMFKQRMATGEFDSARPGTDRAVGGTYGTYTQATHLETAENTLKSLEASHKSIALLRNEGNILPLDLSSNPKIAVVGKFLDRCELGDSNYASNPTQRTTYRQGITNVLNNKGFNTATNLKFYAPAINVVSGNLMYIRSLNVNGIQYNASSAYLVANGTKSGNNIQNATDGAYALYNNIDLTAGEVKSFSVEVSTQSATGAWDPVVELRIGGPEGDLISRVVCKRTSGWTTFELNVGEILAGIVHSEDKMLCLRFTTTSSEQVGLTAAQLNEIADADVVIYVAGTGKDPTTIDVARENRDRFNMNFPAGQAAEIRAILEKNPNVILPIQAVGMMNITEFVRNPDPTKNVKAALFTGFNGQFQGTAMADVLFGNVNPSARLSFTWYADESQMPIMPPYTTNQRSNPVNVNYGIRPTEEEPWGRTYQYYTGDVLYPFGYGLSYSTFTYNNPSISKSTVSNAEKFYVEIDVTNTSSVDGTEIVQAYMVPPRDGKDPADMPKKQLKGYTRVDIPAGQTKRVRVELNTDEWWFVDTNDNNKRVVSEGQYKVELGRSTKEIIHTFNVTINGKVAPWLQNVNLDTDTIKVTQSRQANAELSIALSDETFLNPAQATVVYTSNRPDVASVNQNGVVTSVSSGTAVITAEVTYNGQKMSDSFAVVSEGPEGPVLKSIIIDGVAMENFVSTARNYNYSVAIGAAVPIVKVEYDTGLGQSVTIGQATSIPGTATITAVRNGVTAVFTINFYNATMKTFRFNQETISAVEGVFDYDVYVPNSMNTISFTDADIAPYYPDSVNVSVALNPANGEVSTGKPCVATVKIACKGTSASEIYTINFGHMTFAWGDDVNEDGFHSYANVRFSDGITEFKMYQAWYDEQSNFLTQLTGVDVQIVGKPGETTIPKHNSGTLTTVYKPPAGGEQLSTEWLRARKLKKFLWDSNYKPLIKAHVRDWILPEVNGISVRGTSITDFRRDKFEYEVVVPFGNITPTVTAFYDASMVANARISQASGVPGTATLEFTSLTGTTATYTINFVYSAPSRVKATNATPTDYLDPNDAAWANAEEIYINKRSTVDNSSELNAYGKAKFLWDNTALYARIEIHKNIALNNANSSAHLKDSVELFISEENYRGASNYSSSQGNQYRINFLGERSQKSTHNGWGGSGRELTNLPDGEYGYVLTYMIPHRNAAVVKESGTIFGMDIIINAMANSSARTCFSWSDERADGYSTSRDWGEIVLK